MLLEKSGGRGPGMPSAGKHTELYYGLSQQHITRQYMVIYLREFSCCAFSSLQGPHPLLFCIALFWDFKLSRVVRLKSGYLLLETTQSLHLTSPYPVHPPSLSYKCAEHLDGINSVTVIKQLPELTFQIVPCKNIQTF